MWAGACLGGGPCPEKSVSLHWVVGNKESMSAGLRAWRKTAPWCKGRGELLLRTISGKRQHCETITQSSKETARWSWGFPA